MHVFAWGANSNGQLGLGFNSEQVSSPTVVNFAEQLMNSKTTPMVNEVSICGGGTSTFLSLGKVQSMSLGPSFSILGNKYLSPQRIACGWDFTLRQAEDDGPLYSCGNNSFGQLGRSVLDNSRCDPEWDVVTDDQGRPILFSKFACGMRHAIGIDANDGTLLVWGENSKSHLGVPSINHPQPDDELDQSTRNNDTSMSQIRFPTRVPVIAIDMDEEWFGLTQVACGRNFSVAYDESGYLFGSGLNKYGQLCYAPQAQGSFERFTQILEKIPNDKFTSTVRDLKCGWSHVVVLLNNGKVLSWGRNNFGQLGRESANPILDPEPNLVIIPEPVIAIACGSEHSMALTTFGKVYTWGWNEHDNCGLGVPDGNRLECIQVPMEVKFPFPVKISAIGCGAGNCFAIS